MKIKQNESKYPQQEQQQPTKYTYKLISLLMRQT